jgi:hypothetical protein
LKRYKGRFYLSAFIFFYISSYNNNYKKKWKGGEMYLEIIKEISNEGANKLKKAKAE